jgi:predicted small secreted protein
MMVRKIFALFAITSSLAVAACNTVAGVGEDVESVGDAVEDCAEGVDC